MDVEANEYINNMPTKRMMKTKFKLVEVVVADVVKEDIELSKPVLKNLSCL